MSQWRVGNKVPINVYEDDRSVCQCHNPEDAARIVAAMNGEMNDLLNLADLAAMDLWPRGHRARMYSLARKIVGSDK